MPQFVIGALEEWVDVADISLWEEILAIRGNGILVKASNLKEWLLQLQGMRFVDKWKPASTLDAISCMYCYYHQGEEVGRR